MLSCCSSWSQDLLSVSGRALGFAVRQAPQQQTVGAGARLALQSHGTTRHPAVPSLSSFHRLSFPLSPSPPSSSPATCHACLTTSQRQGSIRPVDDQPDRESDHRMAGSRSASQSPSRQKVRRFFSLSSSNPNLILISYLSPRPRTRRRRERCQVRAKHRTLTIGWTICRHWTSTHSQLQSD